MGILFAEGPGMDSRASEMDSGTSDVDSGAGDW